MVSRDITTYMTQIFNQIISLITWVFNELNSIEFMNTTLLKFMVGISLIGIFITILFGHKINLPYVNIHKSERKNNTESK